ncbi:MAG: hypothetical protein IKO35_02195, partial [Elusimicrobiaceae bacterium]|nr:hypothetical protein [Elusimicrobiaceae bacterium]
VSLSYEPMVQQPPQGGNTSSFERAYEQFRAASPSALPGTEEPRLFKRIFTLPAADAQERRTQIADFATAMRQAVLQAPAGQQVSLSLQGRTADYAAPGALTQNRTAPPKAVYDPRIVGNDMGLWVMGRNWLKFIEEAEEDLNEYNCPATNTCELLKGLAALAKGNATTAAENFTRAAAKAPQDALPQLGSGTACVVADNDEEARRFYQRALELDPANKTAKRNLKILSDN